ncbi:MAG: DUF3108 domain-containing protein [Pseudomonadota bacterium]
MWRKMLCVAAMLATHSAGAIAASDWSIEPFVAEYKVSVGPASAAAVVELNSLGDSRYEIVSKTRVTGFFGLFKRGNIDERAVFRFEDGEILAESLVREDNLSPEERSCEVYYRPLENEATVKFKGQEKTVTIPRNTFNPLLMQIALMQDMAAGETPEVYNILDHAGLKQFDVNVGTEGAIDTPTGQFAAIPVDITNPANNAGTRMWAVPAEDWLAVVVEARKDDEVKATLKLSGLR